ncbi:MAG: arsenate reductase ArsC [Burkholderiales bacterium]|jgi:arsenate reductase|nr:arsenate reductase ArsC [Burkholderiales bacterium]
MESRVFNVLFLCTANTARSIMAEAILNQLGKGRFVAYSAGSHPAKAVNPHAIAYLERHNISTQNLRCKDWAEFAAPGAPKMDFVLTVCDRAAGEVCPVWPGQPVTAHWGVDDPVAVEGNEEKKMRAFADAYMVLNRRIAIFLNLPLEKLDQISLRRELASIGNIKS